MSKLHRSQPLLTPDSTRKKPLYVYVVVYSVIGLMLLGLLTLFLTSSQL